MTVDLKTNQVSDIVQAAIKRHGADRESLIPVLSDVNKQLGYLSVGAMTQISQALHVPNSDVLSTASFYRLLSTKPRGQHVVKFCRSAPCHVMGGARLWDQLQEELGIAPGQTSEDGRWSLEGISCPGVCGVGPVMMIDDEVYGNLTPTRLTEILAQYQEGGDA